MLEKKNAELRDPYPDPHEWIKGKSSLFYIIEDKILATLSYKYEKKKKSCK